MDSRESTYVGEIELQAAFPKKKKLNHLIQELINGLIRTWNRWTQSGDFSHDKPAEVPNKI